MSAPSLPDQAARAVELGLTGDEYARIVVDLGREPNDVELAMFSLMWSEHCGYKHSAPLLKQLPTEAPWVVQGPGENAGAVDVEVVNPDTAFTRACARGDRLSIPVKHTTGRFYAPEPLDEHQVVLRYAPGHNPNGSQDDIAGVRNADGNVLGLMPHPEHAVDPLTGSADGLKLFESLALERAVAA